MKDVQKLTFAKITEELNISMNTVRRAYDHAHRDEIQKSVENGQTPDRGSYTHLGEEVYQKVREMLKAGIDMKSVAAEAGCSVSTVRRTKIKMEVESGSND